MASFWKSSKDFFAVLALLSSSFIRPWKDSISLFSCFSSCKDISCCVATWAFRTLTCANLISLSASFLTFFKSSSAFTLYSANSDSDFKIIDLLASVASRFSFFKSVEVFSDSLIESDNDSDRRRTSDWRILISSASDVDSTNLSSLTYTIDKFVYEDRSADED